MASDTRSVTVSWSFSINGLQYLFLWIGRNSFLCDNKATRSDTVDSQQWTKVPHSCYGVTIHGQGHALMNVISHASRAHLAGVMPFHGGIPFMREPLSWRHRLMVSR